MRSMALTMYPILSLSLSHTPAAKSNRVHMGTGSDRVKEGGGGGLGGEGASAKEEGGTGHPPPLLIFIPVVAGGVLVC